MSSYRDTINHAVRVLKNFKGEPEKITVGGRVVDAFIHEDTQETSEPVAGGQRHILALSVTVFEKDFQTPPESKTLCVVNSNRLLINDVDAEPGFLRLNLVRSDAR